MIAGEVDVLPTERRSVREQRVRNRLAAAAVFRSQRCKALGNVLLIIGGKARPTALPYVDLWRANNICLNCTGQQIVISFP